MSGNKDWQGFWSEQDGRLGKFHRGDEKKPAHLAPKYLTEAELDEMISHTGYEGGAVAFTDGSYYNPGKPSSDKTGRMGYGVLICGDDQSNFNLKSPDEDLVPTCILAGTCDDVFDEDGAPNNSNATPECEAPRRAIGEAAKLGLHKLTIVFDNTGVANIPLGLHENIRGPQEAYRKFVKDDLPQLCRGFEVRYCWQASHGSGKENRPFSQRGNDVVDALAGLESGKFLGGKHGERFAAFAGGAQADDYIKGLSDGTNDLEEFAAWAYAESKRKG